MAIEIKLYQFSKKENSTKRPGNDDLKGTFPCRLISPTSITSPSVDLALPAGFSVKYVNYAYIQEFDRYYWITGWTYSAGLWIANMTVDALASWKNGIGRSTQYITRSSAENIHVPDVIYPLTNDVEIENLECESYPEINLYKGFYVVTVISDSREVMGEYPWSPIGSYASFTDTWIITPEGLRILSFSLLGSGDLWEQVRNGKYKIGDFVLTIRWCPFEIADYSKMGKYYDRIRIGGQEVYYDATTSTTRYYLSGYKIYPSVIYYETDLIFNNIPKHPQIERGRYLNYEPYSMYRMIWPTIGTVELNSLRMADHYSAIVKIRIDLRSGAGYYEILGKTTTTINPADPTTPDIVSYWEDIVANGSFIGLIDIQISSGQVDGYAMASAQANIQSTELSQISTGIGAIGSALELDFSSVLSAGFDIAKQDIAKDLAYMGLSYASVPAYSVKGAAGSVMSYAIKPRLECIFQYVAAENTMIGKPTLLSMQISIVPGFIQVSNPVLELECTPGELAEIKSYMMGGFFYE